MLSARMTTSVSGSPAQAEAIRIGLLVPRSSTCPVPSAAFRDRPNPSERSDVNRTRRPSRDQSGLTFQPSKVRRFDASRARSWMKMSELPSSAATSSAMRSPAGDSRGAPYTRGGAGIGSSFPARSSHTRARSPSSMRPPVLGA